MTHPRPGVEQMPTPADEAAARAMHALRPAGLPWGALDPAGRRNLAISAKPLRRALEREGWTPARVRPRCGQQSEPAGYAAASNWADGMLVDHDQQQCPGCGRWSVWVQRCADDLGRAGAS